MKTHFLLLLVTLTNFSVRKMERKKFICMKVMFYGAQSLNQPIVRALRRGFK